MNSVQRFNNLPSWVNKLHIGLQCRLVGAWNESTRVGKDPNNPGVKLYHTLVLENPENPAWREENPERTRIDPWVSQTFFPKPGMRSISTQPGKQTAYWSTNRRCRLVGALNKSTQVGKDPDNPGVRLYHALILEKLETPAWREVNPERTRTVPGVYTQVNLNPRIQDTRRQELY